MLIKNADNEANIPLAGKKSFSAQETISIWLIFLAALVLRLWFNFYAQHINCFSSCDAAEYLRNGKSLVDLFQSLSLKGGGFWEKCSQVLLLPMSGHASAGILQAPDVLNVRATLQPLHDFAISGPIFPAFLTSCYFVFGRAYDMHNWMAPLLMQSLFSAFACVLIVLIGARAWHKRVGFVAGLIAIVYPGFIINSGRLYSESFASFLLLAVVYFVICGFVRKQEEPRRQRFLALFASGFLACMLQLTRSIMVALSFALIPITLWQNRKSQPLLSLGLILLGFACVALPWLCMQNLVFGTGSLVVDRVGHYNFFVGNNVSTQGWLSVPYPDGRGIDSKSFPQLFSEAVMPNPNGWMHLMADKWQRLFKFPWNDFRLSIGPIAPAAQVVFHQCLILLACLGLSLALFVGIGEKEAGKKEFSEIEAGESARGEHGEKNRWQNNQPVSKEKYMARLFLFALLVFQCVYLFFITVPRYNLTAMPLLILFAAAALVALFDALKAPETKVPALTVVVLAILFFLVVRLDLLISFIAISLFLLSAASANSNLLCLILSVVVRAVSLLALTFAVIRLSGFLPGQRGLARSLVCVLALIGLMSAVLPVRAGGRVNEWQTSLDKPGQKIVQTLRLPDSVSLSGLKNSRCYLLIDANGAQAIMSGCIVKVNGVRLDGPVIPGLSCLLDMDTFTPSDINQFTHECEYIFDCLTRDATMSNADLRQWFLLPVPSALLLNSHSSPEAASNTSAKNASAIHPILRFQSNTIPVGTEHVPARAMHGIAHTSGQPITHDHLQNDQLISIEIEKTNHVPALFYGSYDLPGKTVTLPSYSMCSWEKAFYGVENESGLTDPCYDTKLERNKIAQAAGKFIPTGLVPLESKLISAKTSSLPQGFQNSASSYNIRLLVQPSPDQAMHGIADLLAATNCAAVVLEGRSLCKSVSLKDLPVFAKHDHWLIRLKGQYKAASPAPKCGVEFIVYGQPKFSGTNLSTRTNLSSYYKSTWAPRVLQPVDDWQTVDISFPFNPGSYPGIPKELEFTLDAQSPEYKFMNIGKSPNCAVAFRNVSLEILSLPSVPFAPGGKVY